MSNDSFGVSMVEDYRLILQQSQLTWLIEFTKENKLQLPEFFIYFILQTPRISFCNKRTKVVCNELKGVLKIQKEDKFEEVPFNFNLNEGEKKLNVNLVYPYEIIDIVDEEENLYCRLNATIFITQFLRVNLDTEVAYIGQAYGKEGSRTAFDRLPSHSTLQKIYSETTPDKSVWISLFSFNRNSMFFLPPTSNFPEDTYEKYIEHMLDPYKFISKEHEINFTEAALIRYFQPKYNTEFKYKFPSRDHTVYSDCYNLGINYVACEIKEDYGFMLGTESIEPGLNHTVFFDLIGNKDFKEMFRII